MSKFKFSVGPWNVHSGADSYGPATREEISFEEKVKKFAELGFSAVRPTPVDGFSHRRWRLHEHKRSRPGIRYVALL